MSPHRKAGSSVRIRGGLDLNNPSRLTLSSGDDIREDFLHQVGSFSRALLARGGSPITVQEYRHQLSRFSAFIGKSYIQDITPADLEKFAEENHLSGNYRQAITAIRSLFKWAYRNDIINKNISERLVLKKESERPIESYVWLTLSEQKSFSESCQKKIETLVGSFFLKTGCRNGRGWPRREFCGLGWEDFDFERNLVKIHGKGAGMDGRIRFAHFDDELKQMLSKYRKSGGQMPIYKKPQDVVNLVRAVATRAGLSRLAQTKHPVHALKHTFCTNWVLIRRLKKRGEDLRGLAVQVGTRSATLEVYIHIADEHLKSSYDETMKLLKDGLP